MEKLTKREEEVMRILWKLDEANVASILKEMPEPKPAYNTVSTFIRILEKKGLVGHHEKNRGHIYFPLMSKETYINYIINTILNRYYDGSFLKMIVSFKKMNE